MGLRAFVFGVDEAILRSVHRALQDAGVNATRCSEIALALTELSRRRFDMFFLDCPKLEDRAMLIDAVRASSSNQRAAIFAVIPNLAEAGAAFRSGANFVLEKPVFTDRVLRLLRAAYGLLLQVHLSYFRLPIHIPVDLRHPGGRVQTTTLNLSRSGMAIRSGGLIAGMQVQVEFTLPNDSAPLNPIGNVVWSDGQDCSGIRFGHLSTQTQQQLRQFLTGAFEIQNKPSSAPGQSAA